jgi:hypothetical protein
MHGGIASEVLPARNRVYIGEAVHKGTSYPGEHQAIISRELWDKVRSIIAENPAKRAGHCRGQTPALLRGLIFAPNGYAMTPAHTRKKGKLYRYYVTTSVQKLGRKPVRYGGCLPPRLRPPLSTRSEQCSGRPK